MTNSFTITVISVVLGTLVLRVGLAMRRIAYIKTRRPTVPQTFSDVITLNDHHRAADYTVAKTRLSIASAVVDTGLTLALTLGGGLAYAYYVLLPLIPDDILRGVALITTMVLIISLASLPLSLISTFGIESHFGFNTTTLKLFIADRLKSFLLTALFGIPLIALLLWLVASTGTLWWLYAWLVWLGFSLLMLVLYPNVIAPLFNRFSPLDDVALTARIDALLKRTGFKSQGVFVMNGSARSRHGNAYFTGFGQSKRIVFYDTLLNELSPAEIEAVLAHELGHFKLKHNRRRMIFNFSIMFLLFFILGQLIHAPWFYEGLGAPRVEYAIGFLLFSLVIPAFSFPFTPLVSLLSRRHEYEADAFATQETQANDLVNALVKLYRGNAATVTPEPFYSAFYDSHPPAPLRIAHLKGNLT